MPRRHLRRPAWLLRIGNAVLFRGGWRRWRRCAAARHFHGSSAGLRLAGRQRRGLRFRYWLAAWRGRLLRHGWIGAAGRFILVRLLEKLVDVFNDLPELVARRRA